MREYGRIHTSFWTSDDIRRLGDDGRMLAAYLVTGPHSNMIGAFRLPDAYVAEDLGWSPQRVSEGFRNLFRNGFATRDQASKWVVVHRYLKWNPVENPNQAKAALKLFEQIPDTAAKHWIALALSEYPDWIPTGRVERFTNPSPTLPEPSRNQDQDQDQEQEQDPEFTRAAEPNQTPTDPQPPTPDTTPAKAPKQPKAPKAKPPPHPRRREVIEVYFTEYERARGTKPLFDDKDGKHINQLLAKVGNDADRTIEVIRSAYRGDAFKARNATIATIAADPSKYLGAPSRQLSMPGTPQGVQPISDAWAPKQIDENFNPETHEDWS